MSRIVGSDGSGGGGGGDVKSVQIKANIQTKIASQIAQNTNRPRGLQDTLIVMKVCQARLSQDIDEADMKSYKQCSVVFDNTEKRWIVPI